MIAALFLAAEISAAIPVKIEPPPSWILNVSAGIGTTPHSPQADLLGADGGYGGTRFLLSLDAAWHVHRRIALGIWSAGMVSTSQPDDNAPRLNELAWFVGPGIHFRTEVSGVAFFVSPRIGGVYGGMGFGGVGNTSWAFAYGLDLTVAPARAKLPVGITLGLIDAPTPRVANGREHNFGGLHLMLTGAFDG
jgi:hypothetical protein